MSSLKSGHQGQLVEQLQQMLATLGYSVTADGKYGPLTEAAVTAFQKANHLTADGIAGPKTLAQLQQAVAEVQKNAHPTPGDSGKGHPGNKAVAAPTAGSKATK